MDTEKTQRMRKDMEILDDFIGGIRAYCYEIGACGSNGELEMRKIKDLAPKVLRVVANYI